jgi:hypothetical protein
MSCYWDVYCITCKVGLGLEANRRPEMMQSLIDFREHFDFLTPAIEKIGWEIELKSIYGHIDCSFFTKHRGHKLVVMNEYGLANGTCGEPLRVYKPLPPRTILPVGIRHDYVDAYCNEPKGHNGAHIPWLPKWKEEFTGGSVTNKDGKPFGSELLG